MKKKNRREGAYSTITIAMITIITRARGMPTDSVSDASVNYADTRTRG